MSHGTTRNALALLALVPALLAAGCGDSDSGPEPEQDGKGPYTAKTDICADLPFDDLVDLLGERYRTADAESDDSSAQSSRCTQSFSESDSSSPYSMSLVTVEVIYSPDVAFARKLYTFNHSENWPEQAQGGKVDDVSGVGREAFRVTNTAGSEDDPIKHLVARDGNAQITVTYTPGYRDDPTEQALADLDARIDAFTRSALDALRD